MTTPAPDPLSAYTLTLNQAATLLDVSAKTIQRAVKAGRLSCIRVPARRGHELRFRPDEVRALAPPRAAAAVVSAAAAALVAPAADAVPPLDTRKPKKKGARERTSGTRAQMAAASARLEGIEVRLDGLAAQQRDLLGALAGLARLGSDVQASLAQQQAILAALNGLPHQLAAWSERLAASSADAAASRERAAWLEGALAETARELAALRAAQIAPPPSPAEPPTAAEAASPVQGPAERRSWWRRLVSG